MIGNSQTVFSIIGATNHSDTEREVNDYYATDPIAIDVLLDGGQVFQKIYGNVAVVKVIYLND